MAAFRHRAALGMIVATGTLGALGALMGCEVAAPTAPAVRPGLVLFGVLDPAGAEQVVLLMRSRASRPDTTTLSVVADDPIVSSGESPVTGARVVLYGASGDSAVAVEDRVRRPDRLGAGVYRFWTSGAASAAPAGAYLPVVTGGRYRLLVTSSLGTAEATTRVPAAGRVVTGLARTVTLGRDSVLLADPSAQGAGFVYALRGATGTTNEGDPQYHRALEQRLILPSGGDDWAFAYARERLRAGTRHVLTVTAADSSYFAYFGAQLDPFADRSQGTTLKGAAGVFGSVLMIYSATVTLVGG